MNKFIQITKIALLTIILAEEVRKATRKTRFLKGTFEFNGHEFANRLIDMSEYVDNLELSDEFLNKFRSN